MTARRGAALAGFLVVVAAVVTLLALRPGPTGSAGPGPAAVVSPVVPIVPPVASPSAPAALPPEGVVAAATSATPSAAPPPATPVAPAPFVQTFAAQPGAKPLPPLASPTAPVSVPANVDGCDHGYGTRTQCVPWTFPSAVTHKCAWLAAQGFEALPVRGTDRHRLDPDRNGIACD
ncbi:hypothetical protein [Paractinoplanes lichenicola]|uniref:Excalibur calcium-binding domain-containing protein n=1 Tax=Paractinoplanes lichenicola TaxID=2802976 RepID=A0ABS1VU62_9ACTN|nr:hypothetical protein [Actinoplanes lichenicola]MBL7257995.1 hypothetical protein [Actinoplanes lichenicola]